MFEAGTRLFEGVAADRVGLEIFETVPTETVTQLTYRMADERHAGGSRLSK